MMRIVKTTKQQLSPLIGKNSRLKSAVFAGPPTHAANMSIQRRTHRRQALFAQFPPPALFAALSRAANRTRATLSPRVGMAVASCERRTAAGGA
jgi:hypothetical protein